MVIAVDFDGTLCENAYPNIGKANFQLIKGLVEQQKRYGAKLILWTCRVGKELDEAIAWCKVHGLTFDTVNENLPELIDRYGGDPRKIFADLYLDDRAGNIDLFSHYIPDPVFRKLEEFYENYEKGE